MFLLIGLTVITSPPSPTRNGYGQRYRRARPLMITQGAERTVSAHSDEDGVNGAQATDDRVRARRSAGTAGQIRAAAIEAVATIAAYALVGPPIGTVAYLVVKFAMWEAEYRNGDVFQLLILLPFAIGVAYLNTIGSAYACGCLAAAVNGILRTTWARLVGGATCGAVTALLPIARGLHPIGVSRWSPSIHPAVPIWTCAIAGLGCAAVLCAVGPRRFFAEAPTSRRWEALVALGVAATAAIACIPFAAGRPQHPATVAFAAPPATYAFPWATVANPRNAAGSTGDIGIDLTYPSLGPMLDEQGASMPAAKAGNVLLIVLARKPTDGSDDIADRSYRSYVKIVQDLVPDASSFSLDVLRSPNDSDKDLYGHRAGATVDVSILCDPRQKSVKVRRSCDMRFTHQGIAVSAYFPKSFLRDWTEVRRRIEAWIDAHRSRDETG